MFSINKKMLRFDWHQLTPEVAVRVKEELNAALQVKISSSSESTEQGETIIKSNTTGLDISPTQALTYLLIDQLDLGTSAPNIQIKTIQQAPDEVVFMKRARYYESKIYSKLYQNGTAVHKPTPPTTHHVDLSKNFGSLPNIEIDDSKSVASSTASHMSFMIPSPQFMTPMQQRKFMPNRSTQAPLAHSTMMMASGLPPYYSMTTFSDVYSVSTALHSGNKHPNEMNNLNSLKKGPLKTHICSIGTVYKLTNDPDPKKKDQMVQTKRRANWWKERISNMENRRDVNNFIPPVQILNNNGTEKLSPTPFNPADENALKEKLLDPGFLLTGNKHGKGGGVKFSAHFSYSGNATIKIATELRVNMPIPGFITIPLEIELTRFIFDGDITVLFYHNSTSNVKQQGERVLFYFENPVLPSFDIEENNTNMPQFGDQKLMANYIIKSTGEYTPLKEFSITVRVGASLSKESPALPLEDKILEDKTEISNFIKEFVHKVVKDLLVYPNVFPVDIPTTA